MNSHIDYKFYRPQKKFGQHYLIDKEVINNIIKLINPQLYDHMIEIGPGKGALSEPICKFLNKLNVIEIDKHLVNYLKTCSFKNKLNIFQEDAMKFNFQNIYDKVKKNIRIIGNLPYNISIPLILYIFKFNTLIYDMHFMFQKEVAERLIAIPGNKNYGRLSIIAQYYCKVIPLLTISAECFTPIPKINSMILRFIPHVKYSNLLNNNIKLLEIVTATAFNQRRKILKHSLSKWFKVEDLIKLDINPILRAEDISIKQYCQLVNYL